MVALAKADPITTTAEAIEAIWASVLDGSYSDVPTATRALWRTFDLSEDERNFLALSGLVKLAELEQRCERRGRDDRPALGWGAPHPKAWDNYLALTFPYEGTSGQKPLIAFDADDLAAFGARCGVLVQAWKRRQSWASEAAALLAEHDAKIVGDLPPDVLRSLDAKAREAMGRQS